MERMQTQYILAALFFVLIHGPVNSFPLDSVLARGDSSVNIIWTPSAQNTRAFWYARCCPTDSNYRHCDFITGTTYRGEAYSYGGEDPYHLFMARIEEGTLVGSHDCHYINCNDPSDSVTGTDCSGFLCYVWNEPRVSTASLVISPRYVAISKSALVPGDALVKGSSHCVLVVEVDTITSVLVWESYGWPINGCRERVINPMYVAWNSYVAIRNPYLVTTLSALPEVDGDRHVLFTTSTYSRIDVYSLRGELLLSKNSVTIVQSLELLNRRYARQLVVVKIANERSNVIMKLFCWIP